MAATSDDRPKTEHVNGKDTPTNKLLEDTLFEMESRTEQLPEHGVSDSVRRLPTAARDALVKARDSALLAVEVYNKPAVTFKSAAYITLMVIAWTSLLHAVFFRRKVKPYFLKTPLRYDRRDGDYRHWDLDECLRRYYGNDTQNPVRKNLEFFIPLRNRIEHRSLPELDPSIFGECQAMLLNFDEFIEEEFGPKWCIRQCLSFALQMYPSSENLAQAVKKNRAAQAAAQFIERYRSSLAPGVYESGKFAFKALLIQVANHPSQDALPIQFMHYDRLSSEEKEGVGKLVALVKYKQVPVANIDTFRAGEVCARVQKALGDPKVKRGSRQIDKFNMGWHVACWRKWNIRPCKHSLTPEATDKQYCIYDRRHNDYGYTEAWVQLLIDTFKDEKAYADLFPNQSVPASQSAG